MFIIILFILLGVLSGWGCRKCEARCHAALSSFVGRWQGRLLTGLIRLLLFLLGIEVGSNRMIVRSLPTLGVEALLLSVAGTLGCCLLAWALWKTAKRGEGKYANTKSAKDSDETKAASSGGLAVMKGSLIVVGFFVLGLWGGMEKLIPGWLLESDVSFVALCGLLYFVGIGIGLNPEIKQEVRSLSPRLALLPVVTIAGSWAGALLAWGLLHRMLSDCMAINSGFAYYSLSSIFITEYRGAELGTIALLANIIREMITLLGAPLMARWFGPLAPISAGGATTMDTTLPIISQTVGQRYVALSIYHGFVVDFTVPFLVSWWCVWGS